MSSKKQKLELHEPKQARSRETYNKLLEAAGELLEEVGIENISTNAIVEKAGLTPPAFYRYFSDKYEILAVLGSKLMDVQNALIVSLLADRLERDENVLSAPELEELILGSIQITEEVPGGPWIMRSLRAVPSLRDIRTTSHNEMAQAITDAVFSLDPDLNRKDIYRQARLVVEIGYAAMELVFDEHGLDREAIARDTAHALGVFSDIVK